ncbi:Undecaprenyl-phosphate mannosyltransferase [Polystyrenella longa]|uniref:Undecaprenyl-phosphate mannosyltransferase n=1 Tax=Polystyrenella longa TaxID=2528007 RepID=A0A518CN67_9PLAN|nr:glycosyltransferase family 2 protein [Polystyrenella longa]QDU80653.1 Undecaprenyl-phosphate mannosyltransferase [Polystyrenella longa]
MSSCRYLTALPVFNEVNHVRGVLEKVSEFSQDILAVDDGSSDGTSAVLDDLAQSNLPVASKLTVVRHPQNQGYGAALVTAFNYAIEHGYDGLVTIDCDGQHQPQLIPELVAALEFESNDPWDIVSGSRYLKQFDGDSTPPIDRRRINIFITEQFNQQFGLNLTDTFCGFKAYRTEALKKLNITDTGYAMPLQVWVQAALQKLRITEFAIPLVYLDEERSFGGSLDDSNKRLAYYQEVIDQELARMNQSEKSQFDSSATSCGSHPCDENI